MSNLDSLLDLTLDDLADLPEFKPFPAGAHKVTASMELKDIGGKECIELTLTLLETLEQANPQDEPSKPGDTANTLFMLDNEYGLGNLKKCATPIAKALGVAKISEVVDACKDVECVVITSLRPDKHDKDKKYLQIKELQVL